MMINRRAPGKDHVSKFQTAVDEFNDVLALVESVEIETARSVTEHRQLLRQLRTAGRKIVRAAQQERIRWQHTRPPQLVRLHSDSLKNGSPKKRT